MPGDDLKKQFQVKMSRYLPALLPGHTPKVPALPPNVIVEGGLVCTFLPNGNMDFEDEGHGQLILDGLRRLIEEPKVANDVNCIVKYVFEDHWTADVISGEFGSCSDARDQKLVLQALGDLRLCGKYANISLCSDDGGIVEGHRVVLAAACPYFDAMFLREFQEEGKQSIDIQEVPTKTLKLVTEFVYSGKTVLTEELVETALHAACLFQVRSLTKACCKFLERQLDNSNCVAVLSLSDMYACADLEEKARSYILQNFFWASESEDFVLLPCHILISLITDKRLTLNRESIYEAVIRWVRHDTQSRQQHLTELLENVGLHLLNEGYIMTNLDSESLILRSNRALALSAQVKKRLWDHKKTACMEDVMVILGGSGYEDDPMKLHVVMAMEWYNPVSRRWGILARLPPGMYDTCLMADAIDSDIYVVSTAEEPVKFCQAWRYSVVNDTWKTLPPMTQYRQAYFRVVALSGQIYVLGNDRELSHQQPCEKYNPNYNTWTTVDPPPKTLKKFSVAVCNNRLFAMGFAATSDEVEILSLDPKTDTWQEEYTPAFKPRRKSFHTICVKNLIYFIGMSGSKVDAYDPEKHEWVKVAPLNGDHWMGAMTVIHGKIFISGGRSRQRYLTENVECYYPESDKWRVAAEMPILRRGHKCLTVAKPVGKEDKCSMPSVICSIS
ncbi:kelch-like protein 21 isoform X2 [Branchiostoma floridae x Branchiostoma belcheri]